MSARRAVPGGPDAFRRQFASHHQYVRGGPGPTQAMLPATRGLTTVRRGRLQQGQGPSFEPRVRVRAK